MKILVIAPEQYKLSTIPEVAAIGMQHHMRIISENVTAKTIFDACGRERFDVIHFLTHGNTDGVLIQNDVLMTPDEVATIARMCGAKLIFFNACETPRLAVYVTRHGVDFAIFAVNEIADEEAWVKPNAFYRAATDATDESLLAALLVADGGEAAYGYAVSPTVLLKYMRSLAELQTELQALREEVRTIRHGNIQIDTSSLTKWFVSWLLVVIVVVSLIILAGRFL